MCITMWLILLVWLVVILVSTIFISQYIKTQKREDVAIAFFVLFLAMSQILAAKIGDFSIGSFTITAPVAVLIFPFTFQSFIAKAIMNVFVDEDERTH